MNAQSQTVYDFEVTDIQGHKKNLKEFTGKVLLIVNTASRCGFTPQYEGLEALYKQYGPQGLVVVGFPCNQFGAQEPEGEKKIQEFCDLNYHLTFPLYSKVEVNGEGTHPLFHFLKEGLPGFMGTKAIKWNFTKFLVNRQGVPVERYAPQTKPEDISADIEKLLKE